MSFHYALPGSNALGRHGARALLEKLQAVDSSVAAIDASYFYLVASSHALQADDHRRLQALLDDEPQAPPADDSALSVHVTARVGTVSAWATKATDIAHNCAMPHIERIERGLHYRPPSQGPPVRAGQWRRRGAVRACAPGRCIARPHDRKAGSPRRPTRRSFSARCRRDPCRMCRCARKDGLR
jgi:hypothetical protein